MAIESIYGLLAYSLITGLFFARFPRIRARLRFSRLAVICSHHERRSLQIRLKNWSSGQVIELSARVLYSYLDGPKNAALRKFAPLIIDPREVAFMPLAWTLHHPSDPGSPLFDLDFKKCCAAHGELLVMIQGVDEGSGCFSDTYLEEIAGQSADVILNAGGYLFFEGDMASFHVLLEGRVDLERDVVRKTSVVRSFEAGDFFGEIPLLLGSRT